MYEEKRAEPGALLAELRPKGRRGLAARRRRAHPLGSAHVDEGAGDGAIAPPFRPLDSLGLWLRYGEESGKERESKEENAARVTGRQLSTGFDPATSPRSRRIETDGAG